MYSYWWSWQPPWLAWRHLWIEVTPELPSESSLMLTKSHRSAAVVLMTAAIPIISVVIGMTLPDVRHPVDRRLVVLYN